MFTWQSFSMARAVTPSDTNNFLLVNGRKLADALLVGGAGNVVLVLEDGTTLTIAAVAGQVIPIKAIRVNASSTTATGLFALYI